MINVKKLHNEIVAAGFEIAGVDENGTVWDINNNEIQKEKSIAAIIAAHDPTIEPVKTITEEIAELKSIVEILQTTEATK